METNKDKIEVIRPDEKQMDLINKILDMNMKIVDSLTKPLFVIRDDK